MLVDTRVRRCQPCRMLRHRAIRSWPRHAKYEPLLHVVLLPARDSAQHRQRGADVRGRRRQAVAGAAAGISAGRLLSAPRRARLLAAPGVGSRRRLGRRSTSDCRLSATWFFTKTAERSYPTRSFDAGRRAGVRQRIAGAAAVAAGAPRRAAAAHSDPPASAQPEPVERGGHRDVRGAAAIGAGTDRRDQRPNRRSTHSACPRRYFAAASAAKSPASTITSRLGSMYFLSAASTCCGRERRRSSFPGPRSRPSCDRRTSVSARIEASAGVAGAAHLLLLQVALLGLVQLGRRDAVGQAACQLLADRGVDLLDVLADCRWR